MTTCPQCDYDLAGLPEEYTCPECGFEYDIHASVIKLTARRLYYKDFTHHAIGAVLLIMLLSGVVGASPIIAAIPVLLLLPPIYRILMSTGKPVHMALNRRGIYFDCPRMRGRFVGWADVGKAEYSWMFGRFRIRDPNGRKIISCSFKVLGSPSMARTCVSAINLCKDLYENESRQEAFSQQDVPDGRL